VLHHRPLLSRNHSKRYTLLYSPPEPSFKSVKNALIGGLVGFPKSGKTNILYQLTSFKSIAADDTPYLQKRDFDAVMVPPIPTPRTFSFLDTRGYFFDIDYEPDKELLKRFVYGLPTGTNFSKYSMPDNTDTNNALSHLVLVVNARDLYLGVTWLASWFYSPTIKQNRIEDISKLYNYMKGLLAEAKYSGDKEEAKQKIVVLVTHMDMFEQNDRHNYIGEITSKLKSGGIPQNFIWFGQKECTWNQADIVAHEKKISDLVKRAEILHKDYYQVLDEENYPPNYMEMDTRLCTTSNCGHRFTDSTKENYSTALATLVA